jgi:hypothetical protein
VILATSILLASLIVLGELAALGRKHADDAETLTTAQLICQTKLNEILVGAVPATPVEDQPVDDAPGWIYSVEVDSLGQYGLVSLQVTASHVAESTEELASETAIEQFRLIRWMRDPGPQNQSSLGSSWLEPLPLDQAESGDWLP